MTKKETAQAQAVKTLQEWGLKDGTTVYAKVARVSASGMNRKVQLFITGSNDEVASRVGIIDISYWAAKALEWGWRDGYNGGISVSGCGMDMLFHTVDSLSHAMGYGSLNQDRHESHIKYDEDRSRDCKECRMARGAQAESIGLKYKQL